MAIVKKWLPIVFDNTMNAYRLDGPGERDGEFWKHSFRATNADDCGISVDKVDTGAPVGDWALVDIDEKEIPAVKEYLQAKGSDVLDYDDAPEKERLMYEMARNCKGGWSANADTFFNAVDENVLDKEVIKEVLVQGVARGIPTAIAQSILERKALPVSENTTGIVDDDILRAKYSYGLEVYGTDAVIAEMEADVVSGLLTEGRTISIATDKSITLETEKTA